jgi:hypothetical protein
MSTNKEQQEEEQAIFRKYGLLEVCVGSEMHQHVTSNRELTDGEKNEVKLYFKVPKATFEVDENYEVGDWGLIPQ